MANSLDPNKRFYFKKLSKVDRLKFLKSFCKKKSVIEIWKKGYEEKDMETFEIQTYDEEQCTINLTKKGNFLKKFLKSLLTDTDVFIRIIQGRDYYFFLGHLKHQIKNQYSLDLENELYIGQQRKNYRLDAGIYIRLKVRVDNKLFSGKDISAGGISLISPSSLDDYFQKGKLFTKFTISMNGHTFDVPKAKLASKTKVRLRERPGELFFKAGLEFIGLPKSTEEKIRRIINYEARGLEIREKFNLKK